jgi:hypothetical protein
VRAAEPVGASCPWFHRAADRSDVQSRGPGRKTRAGVETASRGVCIPHTSVRTVLLFAFGGRREFRREQNVVGRELCVSSGQNMFRTQDRPRRLITSVSGQRVCNSPPLALLDYLQANYFQPIFVSVPTPVQEVDLTTLFWASMHASLQPAGHGIPKAASQNIPPTESNLSTPHPCRVLFIASSSFGTKTKQNYS